MRITVPPDVDLDVRPGATVRELRAALADGEHALPSPVWCGDRRLDEDHPVGRWPLVDGASLGAAAGLACAPARGPYLLATAGPSAGAYLSVATDGADIGRGNGCALTLVDPTVSVAHARVTAGAAVRIKDLGSSNGIRDGATGRVRRHHSLAPADSVMLGDSVLTLIDPGDATGPPPSQDDAGLDHADADGPAPERPAVNWGPAVGSLAGGAALAAATGRWWLALVGAAYPAATAAPELWRRAGRQPPPSLAQLPLAPQGRQWWSRALPVAIVGPAAEGVARAVCLALDARPVTWREPWMRWLAGEADITLVPPGQSPPSWTATVVEASADEVVVRGRDGIHRMPGLAVTAAAADAAARRIVGARTDTRVPATARWADVVGEGAAITRGEPPQPPPGLPRALRPTIGVGADGPVTLDFDADGPHVLVAGTTGAGKSALLATVVLAAAWELPPQDLSVAVIDFKGGALARACGDIPHLAGATTDLDGADAERALAGIAAELTQRKRDLAAASLADFEAWERRGDAPGRVLVVVDEFQELAARTGGTPDALVTLAQQGRSLGMHFVLATQRPSGAVTPDIRANVGATVALRTASAAESHDLIGTGAAASLPAQCPGRAILARGAAADEFQVALPSATPAPLFQIVGAQAEVPHDLAAAVSRRWAGHRSVQPLWRPRPAPTIDHTRAPATAHAGIWLGSTDDPDNRSADDAWWSADAGPLIALGADAGAVLASAAAQARARGTTVAVLPEDPRERARTVAIAAADPATLVIAPDADGLDASLAAVERGDAADQCAALARAGRIAAGVSGTHPPRWASGTATIVATRGAEPAALALWSAPRSVTTGLDRGQPAVSMRGQWRTLSAATASPGTLTELPRLVAPLPDRWHAPPPEPGVAHLGVAGDAAQPVTVAADTDVVVVGPPSATRKAAVTALTAATGAPPDAFDLAALIPGDRRDGAVVIVTGGPRDVAELVGTPPAGLCEPVARPGRAVIVHGGSAAAIQLAEPGAHGDAPSR